MAKDCGDFLPLCEMSVAHEGLYLWAETRDERQEADKGACCSILSDAPREDVQATGGVSAREHDDGE